MDRRQKLHEELKRVTGIKNVYFQPPESIKLKYPCVIYSKQPFRTVRANNTAWINNRPYRVVIVCSDGDNKFAEMLLNGFKYCSYDSRYISNNMYHDSLTIFY